MKIFGPVVHPDRFSDNGIRNLDSVNLFYDGFNECVKTNSGELNVFAIGEPRSIKGYRKKFLEQFDMVLSHRPLKLKTNLVINRPLLQHFCGINYSSVSSDWKPNFKTSTDLIDDYTPPNKRKDRICCITSNKTKSDGHKDRIELIDQCMDEMLPLDLYGVGFSAVQDKFDVLNQYKYALVIENSIEKNYFSEKILDGLISGCRVIYCGCPNISKLLDEAISPYFVSAEFSSKSIKFFFENWPHKSLSTDEHKTRILHSVLNKHNIKSELSEILKRHTVKCSTSDKCIFPERKFFRWLTI